MTEWVVHRRSGRADALHRDLPIDGRAAWFFAVDRPALVLGSTQRSDLAGYVADGSDEPSGERQDARVDVTVRDSGGGAVYLAPGEHLWVDVVIPRDDPVWVDDVGRSALWLGRVWAAALSDAGITGAAVHDGPMVNRALGRHVCFAGLAAGEVTIDGAKAVGISQRRTRAGARFQCIVLRSWDPEPMLAVLAPAIDRDTAQAIRSLSVATVDVADGRLEDTFVTRLP